MPVLIIIGFRVQGHRGNGFRETCEVKCFRRQTQMQDQPETQRTQKGRGRPGTGPGTQTHQTKPSSNDQNTFGIVATAVPRVLRVVCKKLDTCSQVSHNCFCKSPSRYSTGGCNILNALKQECHSSLELKLGVFEFCSGVSRAGGSSKLTHHIMLAKCPREQRIEPIKNPNQKRQPVTSVHNCCAAKLYVLKP